MRFPVLLLSTALLMLAETASAATITLATDPFAGSAALTTPGRQIVGDELFSPFDIANDVFVIDPTVFGVSSTVSFANDVAGNLPQTGLNVVVLESFDNDGDTGTPFGAGNAATLIADRITSTGPGFFIYFNSGLDLPRLVYSTDLSDPTADLKILVRLTNLTAQPGRDALPTITASNFVFATVPEPATLVLVGSGALVLSKIIRRRRRRKLTLRYLR